MLRISHRSDPIEFRRINGAKEGTAQPAGPQFGVIGFMETLDAAKNSDHYKSPKPASGVDPQ